MALVGIARLASESELLESKRAVQYLEIPTRSILNRTKPTMPFAWTINPYRGCERGWHIGLITKSDLVLRDLDLLRAIARANVLSVSITITTTDEKLARLLE